MDAEMSGESVVCRYYFRPSCSCDAGKYLPEGSTVCTECLPGTYADGLTSSAECSQCVAGKYSSENGATSISTCTPCDSTQVSVAGSEECTTCQNGKYKPTDAVTCADCKIGHFCQGGQAILCNENSTMVPYDRTDAGEQTDCVCNAGYTGLDGATCTACEAGKYKIATGDAACIHCLAGQYSTAVGATSNVCQSCPSNSDAAEASDSAAACICNAGFSGVRGELCTQCFVGKYRAAR